MSVTAAKGWRAAAVTAGTKASRQLDLALVVSDAPASVAGAFTTNKAVCAHIEVCRPRVASGHARGVVVSAGIANAATGAEGVRDAEAIARAAANACSVPEPQMLVCSTGVIGGRIPLGLIEPAIAEAWSALDPEGGDRAALAIMTTDTRPKTCVRAVETSGGIVTVGGMAKGAGMIAPDLATSHATMLAFVTTDAAAEPALLRSVLDESLPTTFNAITVDGSASTNDTLLLFANGAAGAPFTDEVAGAVHEVMEQLAYAVVADGEGATKVIRIQVTGAADEADARTGARAVANSLLFRSAVWGGDPNVGRVFQALGQHVRNFDPRLTRIAIAGVDLLVGGVEGGDVVTAAKALAASEVLVEADLGVGEGRAEVLTCDLTPEYVKINADYTT